MKGMIVHCKYGDDVMKPQLFLFKDGVTVETQDTTA